MTEIVKDTETVIAEKKEQEAIELKAHNLLIQGKRNLVCNEIPQAVNQLQEACKLLAEKYGETAKECGEAYFCYGKALLDLARMESGVLGNALEGVPGDTEDEKEEPEKETEKDEEEKAMTAEEREKISEEVIDAMLERDDEKKKDEGSKETTEVKENEKSEKMEESSKKEETKTDEVKTDIKNGHKANGDVALNGEAKEETADAEKAKEEMETDEKKEAKTDDAKKAETDEKKEAETDEKKEGDTEEEGTGEEGEEEGTEEETEMEEGGDGDTDTKDEEDDVTNMQLAWEMLELAKVIYKKQEDKEMQLKAAEAYLKLGEVSMESEQYEKAVEDFNECLKIQKANLEADSRLLAETYYQLGLALGFHCKHDEAIENYKNAINVIEAKQASLNKIIEEAEKTNKGKAPEDSEDPVAKAHKELEELKGILPDIQGKIEDAEEEKKNMAQMKAMVKESVAGELVSTQTGFGSGDASSSSSKDTKAAEDISHLVRRKRKPEEEDEETTKKPRQENGDSKPEAKNEEKMETEKEDTAKSEKA